MTHDVMNQYLKSKIMTIITEMITDILPLLFPHTVMVFEWKRSIVLHIASSQLSDAL